MDEKNCCCRTTRRSAEEKKKLLNRLSRIEGQIRGIRGMLESDAYCADILTQSAAVNAAINAFNRELIASHLKGCVVRDIRDLHRRKSVLLPAKEVTRATKCKVLPCYLKAVRCLYHCVGARLCVLTAVVRHKHAIALLRASADSSAQLM